MESIELRHYFQLVRRWLWVILLCTIVASAAAYLFSRQQPAVYVATSTVMLQASRAAQDQVYQDLLATQRLTSTYTELMKRPSVEEAALDDLGYEPAILSITPSTARDTSLMYVRVESDDPEAAAFIANMIPEIVAQEQREQAAARYAEAKSSLLEEIDAASEEIADLQAELMQTDNPATESRLESSLALAQSSFDALQDRLTEVRLQEAQEFDMLSVVEEASVPEQPIRPRPLLNALLAGIVGALVALGAAFLIEYLDNTVKADTDLGSLLEANMLALVGDAGNGGANPSKRVLVDTLRPHDPMTEAYRMLRTNLRFVAIDEQIRSIVVSSPSPSEGKSITAANLAIVMAQAGHGTILVDVDLRRPVQHKIFGVENRAGLTSVLADRELSVRETLQPTLVNNLYVLPSGPIPPNPSELIGSKRMREILHELEELADHVIMDSAPILAVSDTSLLAAATDGVIVVLRANVTTLEAAVRAVDQLRSVNARIVGTVLNAVKRDRGGYYYYYNQSYGEDQSSGGKGDGSTVGLPKEYGGSHGNMSVISRLRTALQSLFS